MCHEGGLRMVVEHMDKNRIESILLYVPEPEEERTENGQAAETA